MLWCLKCLVDKISTVTVEIGICTRLTILGKLVAYVWKPSVRTRADVSLLHELSVLVYLAKVGIRDILLVHGLRRHLLVTLLESLSVRKDFLCVLAGKRWCNVWLLVRVLFLLLLVVTISTLISRGAFTSTLTRWIVIPWRWLSLRLIRWWVRTTFACSKPHGNCFDWGRNGVHVKHYFADLRHRIFKGRRLIGG